MKAILVTGASSGIGRALAVRAARAGYAVYAVARNLKALAALGAQISDEGGIVRIDATDVSEPGNAPALVGRMLDAFGRIDVLVNNAGTVAVGPIASQSDDALRAQFGTHVIGPLALVREALPSLREARGQVFMLGSGVARVPIGNLGAYPPSKAALRSATTILRRELAPLDVAVTYVDPGAVDTPFMSRAGLPGAPPSVLVSPELVARKILFAIGTRPRVVNVAPLQTAAVAVAEFLPGITEAVLERNPQLVGTGPMLAIESAYATPARTMALPGGTDQDDSPDESELLDEIDDADVVEADVVEAEDAAMGVSSDPVTTAMIDEAVIEPLLAAAATPPQAEPLTEPAEIPTATVVGVPPEPRAPRWKYEPPEADDAVIVEIAAEPAPAVDPTSAEAAPAAAPQPAPAAPVAADPFAAEIGAHEEFFAPHEPEPTAQHDDAPAPGTSSFDAALEGLRSRMERSKLGIGFVRELLVPDAVLDVGETAMRWAGMPNKHERALTSEIFFALAEWGFLAPRADGRYRVLKSAD